MMNINSMDKNRKNHFYPNIYIFTGFSGFGKSKVREKKTSCLFNWYDIDIHKHPNNLYNDLFIIKCYLLPFSISMLEFISWLFRFLFLFLRPSVEKAGKRNLFYHRVHINIAIPSQRLFGYIARRDRRQAFNLL